jgi:hypothetical protein
MLHFAKFRQDLLDPTPAREIYVRRGPGRGWPEACPPIRAANAFGFDLPANFDVTFVRRGNRWRATRDVVIESDFRWAADEAGTGEPLTQAYAWFWEKGRKLPHAISPHVHRRILHQVKISTFLYLRTDPNELLLMTDVPNLRRPWRAMTALIETDWYPASAPWHVVVELDAAPRRITIKRGEPLCRLIPVRRDAHFAGAMSPAAFDEFFERGQRWLAAHGRFGHGAPGEADITGTYVRQQVRSKFVVRV